MLGFLLDKYISIAGFLVALLLVSTPFLSRRIYAKDHSDHISEYGGIHSANVAAMQKRFNIGQIIRRYETHKLTINLMVFYVVTHVVRVLIAAHGYLMYQKAFDVDLLLEALFIIMLIPTSYIYMNKLFYGEKTYLGEIKKQLVVDENLSMKDITAATVENINNSNEYVLRRGII